MKNLWRLPIVMFIVAALMLFGAVDGIGQPSRTIDSLQSIVRNAERSNRADTSFVRTLNALARAYRFTNPDKATEYAQKAQVLAQTIADTIGETFALRNIGIFFMDKGFTEKAVEHLLRAVRLSEYIGDSSGIAKSLNALGLINQQKSQYALAGTYLRKALPIAVAIKDKELVSYIRNNLGLVLWKTQNYDSALVEFQYALSIQFALGDSAFASRAYHNIGLVLLDKRDTALAEEYFLRSANLSSAIGDQPGLMKAYYYLALLHLAHHRPSDARALATKAYQVATALGYRSEERYIAILLAECYAVENDYRTAYKFSSQAALLSDTLYNTESAKRIASLQAMYDTERKDFDIQRLEQARIIQNMEQSRATVIRNILIAGLVLLSIILGWGIHQYNLKQRSGNALEQKNTELLNANNEILRQQGILEHQAREIELSNAELTESNALLQHLHNEKNEFLGIAAHDLKNPLAHIILTTGTITRYFERMTDNDVQEQISTINAVAVRMTEIISNLLDVNAIERGALTLHPTHFDIVPNLRTIVEEYTSRAKEKDITLHTDMTTTTPFFVFADESATKQVLDNIISNAVKYSPLGKKVFIRVKADTEWIRVEVQDEGAGISAEEMTKLFGKFARLSARPTGGEHSTGLGLSIVKKMVEAMQGRVWCESEVGKGATFIVELPRQ